MEAERMDMDITDQDIMVTVPDIQKEYMFMVVAIMADIITMEAEAIITDFIDNRLDKKKH